MLQSWYGWTAALVQAPWWLTSCSVGPSDCPEAMETTPCIRRLIVGWTSQQLSTLISLLARVSAPAHLYLPTWSSSPRSLFTSWISCTKRFLTWKEKTFIWLGKAMLATTSQLFRLSYWKTTALISKLRLSGILILPHLLNSWRSMWCPKLLTSLTNQTCRRLPLCRKIVLRAYMPTFQTLTMFAARLSITWLMSAGVYMFTISAFSLWTSAQQSS